MPNQGIHRTARNALVFGGLGGAIAFVLLIVLGPRQVAPSSMYVVCTALVGLDIGIEVSLWFGTASVLRHLLLRFWFSVDGWTPWNYVKFLDYAADRILLRKVGGGYMFIHRTLLEYFAARYVEPGVREEIATKAIDAE
jgi:hypothetical protein